MLAHWYTSTPIAFSFALLALPACSFGAAGSEPASSDDDYTVQPTGGTGKLRVSNPTGARLDKVVANRSTRVNTVPDVVIPVDTDVALSDGSYCLATIVDGVRTKPHCGITITNGTMVSYALGAVTITKSIQADVLGVDIAPQGDGVGDAPKLLRQTTPFAHAAGEFKYEYLKGVDFHTVKVTEGEMSTIDLTAIDHPTLRIVYEAGSMPDADVSRTHTFQIASLDRWRTQQTYLGVELPVAKSGHEIFVRADRAGNGVYGKVLGFGALAAFAPAGSPPGVMKFHRLEIADADVTLADGTTVKVPVRATVTGEGDSWWGIHGYVLEGLSAGQGTNWPDGHYYVTTEFIHPVDGTPVTQTQSVYFR